MNLPDDYCGLCDCIGLVMDPANPGLCKKCPECDHPPPPTLAGLVGEPEEGEQEYWSGIQTRMKARADRRDAELIEKEHAAGITGYETGVGCLSVAELDAQIAARKGTP